MWDVVIFVVTTVVLPVVINKTTEICDFDWIKLYLRPIWTAIFVLFSIYLLQKPDAMEIAMQFHKKIEPWIGYLISGICGAALLCGYWWFAGKMFDSEANSPLSLSATADDADYLPGATISGILWSSRFAELRIGCCDSTNNQFAECCTFH